MSDWIDFVKKYHEYNPNLSYKECLSKAAPEYKKYKKHKMEGGGLFSFFKKMFKGAKQIKKKSEYDKKLKKKIAEIDARASKMPPPEKSSKSDIYEDAIGQLNDIANTNNNQFIDMALNDRYIVQTLDDLVSIFRTNNDINRVNKANKLIDRIFDIKNQ